MNLLHLITLPLLVVSFSGRPSPEKMYPVLSAKNAVTDLGKKETAEEIPWISERRLTWDDYLCEPVRNTDAVASTSTSLGISYQVIDSKLNYHITCGFSKIKSWGLVRTNYILAHEQGHFDITEIFARKLYQALHNYNFNRRTFKKDINSIYQEIVRQKEDYQEIYDGETDHSRNRKLQNEWLDKIDNLLSETEVYSNYP
ncbi:MAG TPA: DUF922 domain-containing protein [Flavisolibacter sp.]|nr:DUF922 domain-containing protein [Flavisolibacter sp.]